MESDHGRHPNCRFAIAAWAEAHCRRRKTGERVKRTLIEWGAKDEEDVETESEAVDQT